MIAWLLQAGSDSPWPVPNVPGMPKYVQNDHYATSPSLGQHTTDVLRDIGYGEADIARWLDDGVIVQS